MKCSHPPAETLAHLYWRDCGAFRLGGLDLCGDVDGEYVCVRLRGHESSPGPLDRHRGFRHPALSTKLLEGFVGNFPIELPEAFDVKEWKR